MKLFRKLHGRKTPHGLEIRILRRLPRIALVGSLLPIALSVPARSMPGSDGVMQGPACVADAYPVGHADHPASRRDDPAEKR